MKKIIVFALSIVLLISLTVSALAASEKATISEGIVPEDFNDLFVESLDKSLSAGIYVDDNGDVVLAVTNVSTAEQAYTTAQSKGISQNSTMSTDGSKVRELKPIMPVNIEPLEIVEVQYSLAQLENARDDLVSKWKELGITAVGIDSSVNGLAVYADDISDVNQSLITNSSKIKNLVFYSNELIGSDQGQTEAVFDSEETSDNQTMAAAAISTIYSGKYFWRQETTGIKAWSSVGWRAKVGGVLGYITCGHGYSSSGKVYYSSSSSDLIGTISKWKNSGKCDYAFVPSSVAFGGMRGDGQFITVAGSPAAQGTVIFDGARHYQDAAAGSQRVTAKITSTGTTVIDTFDDGSTCTDLIIFDKQPWHGDSGCAIIQVNGSEYKLVGFCKSQYKKNSTDSNFSYGSAVKYTNVRDDIATTTTFQIMN